MSKLEHIGERGTTGVGLWWHPDMFSFTSQAVNLSDLKRFKGAVRFYVRKNRFFNGGENGRPNYLLSIWGVDTSSPKEVKVIDETSEKEERLTVILEDGKYYLEDGTRLFTRAEVETCIHGATEDGARGYDAYDNIISDYIDGSNRRK